MSWKKIVTKYLSWGNSDKEELIEILGIISAA